MDGLNENIGQVDGHRLVSPLCGKLGELVALLALLDSLERLVKLVDVSRVQGQRTRILLEDIALQVNNRNAIKSHSSLPKLSVSNHTMSCVSDQASILPCRSCKICWWS